MRSTSWILVFAAVASLSGSLLLAPADALFPDGYPAYVTRPETATTTNLTAYLSKEAGGPVLEWSAVPPTGAQAFQVALVCDGPSSGKSSSVCRAHFEVDTDPFPKGALINVSHDVAFTAYVATTPAWLASQVTAEIHVTEGGQFVGAALPYGNCDNLYSTHGEVCPSWKPGPYPTPRSWRWSPEVAKVKLGARWHLAFDLSVTCNSNVPVCYDQNYNTIEQIPVSFGPEGAAATNLRIATYADDEAFFRHPEVFPGAAPPAAPPVQRLGDAQAAAVPLLLALATRRRGVDLVLFLILGAFAGCVAPAPDTSGADIDPKDTDSKVVLVPTTGPNASSMGSISGFVRDTVGQPVGGAHVSLLEANLFTTTTSYGRFGFPAVFPGDYSMRLEKDGFNVFNLRIRVEIANLTLVNLQLQRADGSPQESHAHDYWGTSTSFHIMDEPVPNPCTPYFENVDFGTGPPPETHQYCQTGAFFSLPTSRPGTQIPNLIVPGTAELELEFSWSGEVVPARLGLLVVTPADNYGRYLLPRLPGEPFRLQVAWEMTDVGHALLTQWTFAYFLRFDDPYLAPPTDTTYAQYTNIVPEHRDESWMVDVMATLHRGGALRIENAHKDFWGDASSIEVLRNTIPFPVNRMQFGGRGAYNWPQFSQNLTPPGTQWLEVTAAWPIDPTPAYEARELSYISADVPPACGDPCLTSGAPPAPDGPRRLVWKIPVAEKQTDPYYAKASNWRFFIVPSDQRNADTYAYLNQGGNVRCFLSAYQTLVGCERATMTFVAMAHRDAMPT